jgi:DegV family protein with EDD domain
VVPLTVRFGDTIYRDGVDIDSDAFFARLQARDTHPETKEPPVTAFAEVYDALLSQGHAVLSVHVSSDLSQTYAQASAARLASANPDRIILIDSRWTSMPLGMAAVAGARALQAGQGTVAALDAVRRVLDTTQLRLFVDTLTYLQRGGRIGPARALLGSLLDVKPLLTITDGVVQPAGQVRTREHAIDHVRRWSMSQQDVKGFTVVHTRCAHEAQDLHEHLRQQWPQADAYLTELGPVVATHIGPGSIGVALHQ